MSIKDNIMQCLLLVTNYSRNFTERPHCWSFKPDTVVFKLFLYRISLQNSGLYRYRIFNRNVALSSHREEAISYDGKKHLKKSKRLILNIGTDANILFLGIRNEIKTTRFRQNVRIFLEAAKTLQGL